MSSLHTWYSDRCFMLVSIINDNLDPNISYQNWNKPSDSDVTHQSGERRLCLAGGLWYEILRQPPPPHTLRNQGIDLYAIYLILNIELF